MGLYELHQFLSCFWLFKENAPHGGRGHNGILLSNTAAPHASVRCFDNDRCTQWIQEGFEIISDSFRNALLIL
jgi:hypothetical protein